MLNFCIWIQNKLKLHKADKLCKAKQGNLIYGALYIHTAVHGALRRYAIVNFKDIQ